MTPKIDYALFGRAMSAYIDRGYTYVETPWVVPEKIIRATLPPEFGYFEQMMRDDRTADAKPADCRCPPYPSYKSKGGLVGSAEQGFLALSLPDGAYVGAGPCFRDEEPIDLYRRPYFMKIELFVTLPDAEVGRLVTDAQEVMSLFTDEPIGIAITSEGFDLEIGEMEVGSYGERIHPQHGRWLYGTGLALPRFSVARALSTL